jgi:HK97 family phage portal protein
VGFLERLFQGVTPDPEVLRVDAFSEYPSLETQYETITARHAARTTLYPFPTIREALSVPAVFRAVSLLATVAGSLPIQAFRNSLLMDEPPALIRRPDPNTSRRRFIRQTVWNMATRGEAFWYVTARDPDGKAAALLNVPTREVQVEWDERQVRKVYRWRDKPMAQGQLRHLTFAEEDGSLRGVGPLQLCGAAVSSAIEATEWAASFFAEGGVPSINLHSAVDLDETEATALRDKWISNAGNTARVTSGPLELREVQISPQDAQLLEARMASVGDVARMFGIPAHLLAHSQPGSSLTYQNLDMVAVELVRFGLGVGYLEPIEDELSDLLTRSTTAQFWVDGIQRADSKTRWETYEKAVAVLGPEEGAEYARRGEGLVPGNPNIEPTPILSEDVPLVPEK